MSLKPKRLKTGDKIAIVSLSSGIIGEPNNIYRFEQGKRMLEEGFGLQVVAMPHALKGKNFVKEHPELRAKDLMDAFADPSIAGIITMTGGSDTVRLLPYINYDTIKNNPKVFMGFSDTTANHFMLRKAGINSFYGPALAVEFSACKSTKEKTMKSVRETLFESHDTRELKHSGEIVNDPAEWTNDWAYTYEKDPNKGYVILQGKGKHQGVLLGGCVELFMMINGTEVWPSLDEWKGKILCLETSEEKMTPSNLKYILYGLAAQGILGAITGILFARPKNGVFYDEYNKALLAVAREYGREDLPIVVNAQFGHSWQWNILPLGCKAEIDCEKRKITLLENVVLD